jgi:hypothetical protein
MSPGTSFFPPNLNKDAKDFIDDLSDVRMFSTDLYAYIDNELFKFKQFKDLQFHSIEKATDEIISSVIGIKEHIIGNLESEYKELVNFLKKTQLQFKKGISFLDSTLRTIHPNDKLCRNELQNLEKKLLG